MPTLRLLRLACLAGCLLLAGCPGGGSPSGQKTAAPAGAGLQPRAPLLPGTWAVAQFKPAAGLQQIQLPGALLAAIAARSGTGTPLVSGNGYEVDREPYREGVQDDGLVGLSGSATATDAPDATDRARPPRRGQYALIACSGSTDWDQLAADTERMLASAGYHRIEGSEGPEGELARFINSDETALAVLVHRTPRSPAQEFGLKDEYVYMACSLEAGGQPGSP
jgi:hypothetical protein